MDVLSVDHPQSVRHVFYRMTDPRLPVPIAKTDQGATAPCQEHKNHPIAGLGFPAGENHLFLVTCARERIDRACLQAAHCVRSFSLLIERS